MRVHGKPRRVRLVEGRRRDWKKAIVTVEKGQTITFFEGV
jgi:ribosomal protein L23